MKKFILIILCLSFITLSCNKEAVRCYVNESDSMSLAEAVTLTQGNFVFTNSKLSGIGKIYQQKNGRYVVAFEQMNVTNNTDMQIYLSKTADLSETSVKLFSAQTISGNKYYLLPANFFIDGYSFLLIMDDRHENALGVAALE